MTMLAALRPASYQQVMHLVREAGVDVSDWANYRHPNKPAANPKYCYEWAFVEPDKVVVLNLWHDQLREQDGRVTRHIGPQEFRADKAVWKTRIDRLAKALRTAYERRLPVRVIVCDGRRRESSARNQKPSRVSGRLLDPVSWAVTSYDARTDECVLVRGAAPAQFVDQYSEPSLVQRRLVSGMQYVRGADVRAQALRRANGHCEYCGAPGFRTMSGAQFLETHHVVPLSESGADTLDNVVALCPSHHREAHLGVDRADIMQTLLAKLSHHGRPTARHGK